MAKKTLGIWIVMILSTSLILDIFEASTASLVNLVDKTYNQAVAGLEPISCEQTWAIGDKYTYLALKGLSSEEIGELDEEIRYIADAYWKHQRRIRERSGPVPEGSLDDDGWKLDVPQPFLPPPH